jgi:hypothetical protein
MYASNVLAAAVFFGRPAVALWGGVAMGLTVVPWARLAVPELLGPASPTPRDPLAPHPAGPSR